MMGTPSTKTRQLQNISNFADRGDRAGGPTNLQFMKETLVVSDHIDTIRLQ
jgi:hypothetical protein